jgi:PAS domain S-box-containing protein
MKVHVNWENMQIQTVVFLLSILMSSVVIAVVSQQKQRIQGIISLTIISTSLIIWSSAYLLYNSQLFFFPKMVLLATTYFCSALVTSAQLTFSLTYSGRSHWITRSFVGLLLVQPLLTQILFWVERSRNIFFIDHGSQAIALSYQTGIWTHVNSIYLYNFEILSVLLLLDTFARKPRAFFKKSGVILFGSLVPLIFRLAAITDLVPQISFDPSIIAYSLAVILFSYGLFRSELIETVPITRDTVIEGMQDGWMVIDGQNKIIDINPAAEKLTGLSYHKVYGQPTDQILPDWLNITNAFEGIKELDVRRSIKTGNNWRYLNIRISPLTDPYEKRIGHLILWRDVTERRKAENARQKTRDEMLTLLNAISSTASNALGLDEFLSESIYQIISPFHSQAALYFLVDQNRKEENDQRMILATHYGFPKNFGNNMENMPISSGLFDLLFMNKQPVLLDDIRNDLRLPSLMNRLNFSSMLVAPLIIDEEDDKKVLGCLCLARTEGIKYTQDEIIRLTVISDQIASLINNDRRRQVNIALSERQRLLRDLHDSVSQKLYGLVTLTEAAQAAQEAGSPIAPSIVLEKIGENARQAVKEMRLFLYEMQPMDLKKEGLVSILHHRLAAVEGRANVKARLLTDEKISLSQDKEVALYFISQEALNNILRHAHAKSISVTLKQTRQNIVLEIVDDGRGFDPKKVARGGMGLHNMKERTSQVNGKLKIVSKPGNGTKIVVTVAKQRVL